MPHMPTISGLFRSKGEKKLWNRLKKSRHAEIRSLLISPQLEIQSPRDVTFAYWSGDDVGRGPLQISNPDPRCLSVESSSITLVPTSGVHRAETIPELESRAIEELQSLPGFYGPGASTGSSNTRVGQSSDELIRPSPEIFPGASQARPLNPLQANPPLYFQERETGSWLDLNASADNVALERDLSSQTDEASVLTAGLSRPFNPLTVEDCPPKAVPAMHGPGSRYSLYSQPETFNNSSERLALNNAAEAAVQDRRIGTLQPSRPRRRLPQRSPEPEPESIFARIIPVMRYQQQPSAADSDSEEGTNPLGHYVDRDELFLHQTPAEPPTQFSEPTEARRKSNMERLKRHTRRALDSLRPTTPLSSPPNPTTRRRRDLEDLYSFVPRPLRCSASSANHWGDYAVIESHQESAPRRNRSLSPFNKFRLTLSRTAFRASNVRETLRETRYFSSRHHRRQNFLRRTFTKIFKKDLQMKAVTKYLGDALEDWGSFEIDFSGIGVEK